MKNILITAFAAISLLASIDSMAGSKKSSSAIKLSSSGEAMHKKNPAKITADRNLAKAKKTKVKKVASK